MCPLRRRASTHRPRALGFKPAPVEPFTLPAEVVAEHDTEDEIFFVAGFVQAQGGEATKRFDTFGTTEKDVDVPLSRLADERGNRMEGKPLLDLGPLVDRRGVEREGAYPAVNLVRQMIQQVHRSGRQANSVLRVSTQAAIRASVRSL